MHKPKSLWILCIVLVFFSFACILTDAISPPGTLAQPTAAILPVIRIADTFLLPDEPIQVYFTAPASFNENALIAILPADAPHANGVDSAALMVSYQFLDLKTSGILDFITPHKLGFYELRMYGTENNNAEVATFAFKVTDIGTELYNVEATLKLDKKHYLPGEQIKVFFTAPEELSDEAWVGTVSSSIPHGSEEKNLANVKETQMLNGRKSGILFFTAPDYYDSYDIRLNNKGAEEASVSFRVVEY